MKFLKSEKYDNDFLKENMMGPNSIKLLEDLTSKITLRKGMRVLDLGCGKGLTSIFLAKEYGVTVYATDLWIPATENYLRFRQMGLQDQIIPIHSDALELPYADEFFDAVVCIDSYTYFGANEQFMDKNLAPLVKAGGDIAISIPGLKEELEFAPEKIKQFFPDESWQTFHSIDWWSSILKKSQKFHVASINEFESFDEVWKDWLECDDPYAIKDRDMIKVMDGKFMNLISIIGKRI